MSDMSSIYTVTCDYAATGEGRTLMLLITRVYGSQDGATNALERFKEIFGDYYAQGAKVEEGLQLNKSWIPLLMSAAARKKLMEWQLLDRTEFSNFEYFSNLHVNFS
jgi:hypothetical protein